VADSQHTLEIRSTLKDEASGKLKKMGVEGEKAGKRTEGSLKRVEKQADKTGRSMLDAGQAGSKGAGIAGAGFSSLAAGMTAATATSENLEASMVSVGAAVAAAFAAGGPVGAGLALAATGLGLLIGQSKKAGQAAAEAAKEFEEGFKRSADATRAATQALQGLQVQVLKLKGIIADDDLDVSRLGKALAIKQQIEKVDELGRAWRKATGEAEKAARARSKVLSAGLPTDSLDEYFSKVQAAAAQKRDELESEQDLLRVMRQEFALSAEAEKVQRERAESLQVQKEAQVEVVEDLRVVKRQDRPPNGAIALRHGGIAQGEGIELPQGDGGTLLHCASGAVAEVIELPRLQAAVYENVNAIFVCHRPLLLYERSPETVPSIIFVNMMGDPLHRFRSSTAIGATCHRQFFTLYYRSWF